MVLNCTILVKGSLIENELKKLKTFDLSYFKRKSHFEEDGTQNYFVFSQYTDTLKRYFAGVGSGNYIYWKFKGLSNERINHIKTSDYIITSELICYGTKTRVKFSGSCLKQDRAPYTHGKIVNIYIVYEIRKKCNISSHPTLKNCSFRAVSLTKHIDIDQYKCSGYGVGFDRRGEFSFGNGYGRNVIIFGADMSSSIHATNKTQNILFLGRAFAQGLANTTIYAEKLYSVNFTKTNTKFCLSLRYNGANSYLFVNSTEIHKFKAKDPEIVATQLCLGNISKDFSVDNKNKTGLNGYVYDFSVDYDAIAVDDILDIHEKSNII